MVREISESTPRIYLPTGTLFQTNTHGWSAHCIHVLKFDVILKLTRWIENPVYQAAYTFNALTHEIRSLNVNTFKSRVKNYLTGLLNREAQGHSEIWKEYKRQIPT